MLLSGVIFVTIQFFLRLMGINQKNQAMNNLLLIFRTILVSAVLLFFITGTNAQTESKSDTGKTAEKKPFDMNPVKVEHHGKDTTYIIITHHGGHDRHCPFGCRKGKFNGHWAGIDFGWNGYVNSSHNTDFPASQEFLELKTARSLTVDINPFELNLAIVKRHFGLTSGLGFTFNNYYFSNSTLLIHDSSELVAYQITDKSGNPADLKMNKLTVMWITLPVLLEFQTNAGMKWNSFHVTAGVIGGVRVCSYTKQSFKIRDESYFLTDNSNNPVGSFYVDKRYSLTHNQYHLNPFKLDATVRIGWSFLNLFANYSLTPMFQKDKGPEVYSWEMGIMLAGW